MQIPVLIEKVKGNGFRARGTEPFALTARGATREEALTKLRAKIQARLRNGTEVVGLEIAPEPHRWMKFAGMFSPDDPLVQEWKRCIEEYRQQVDDDPDAI